MQHTFRSILPLGLAAALVSSASAAVTFNFTYADVDTNSGFGFDDATEGATRRTTVAAVATYLNTVIDHTATVDITWDASINEPSATTLASMGTAYYTNQGTYAGILHEHITTGTDPDGGNDGSGQVNFGRTWNSGTDPVAADEFDLFTVVLHELTHALGVASLIEADGTQTVPGTYSTYDTFLRNSGGSQIVDNSGSFVGTVADLTSGNVTILTDAGSFDIFAPDTYKDGSSISHFADNENAVMNPSVAPNIQKREYLAADRAVLSQLGYTLKPLVPEPNSTILCAVGFAGLILHRRK